jgi:hypothetical protein
LETITITFSKDGEVIIQTEGFKGAGCKAATRDLAARLGVTTSDVETEEYWQEEVASYATTKR